ncbi:LacI family DNA-binding transcriptional regulator [Alteromonas aestuariivivens]|uniref:LacI family DNA-binding transcriptional regulator n=1 Tax=Alteromonas aestuariivivens TaxID=1938339 RepID=A0A3D8MA79_9ALTE|nr:LacI family DNA-binding transcriptional regulator [Alteromonas aestuariivivens]RDV26861.1 LacI family DNA-binding transcriptional regulator [Alteromonas aestuariivivens]
MVTIKQVSERAGVSSATVSRVINNADSVKENTRKLVMDAMADLGYRHNVLAASLASNKTNTVGYVVPELHGSFFGSMMAGSEQVLRKANKHMFVATGHSDESTEKKEIEALLSRRCDALILHVEAVSDDYLINLARQDVPLVVVNRYIEEIGEHCISLDNIRGGYLATRHLIELGHTSIAYVAGAMFKADSVNRLEGHKQALAEAGLQYNESLTVEGNFQAKSGEDAIRELARRDCYYTAVACANDEMACGAINALATMGRSVPRDVSVIGYDNIDFASYLTPGLTTINYPVRDIGTMAARWILNHAYGDHKMTMSHVLEPHLVVRGTTKRN